MVKNSSSSEKTVKSMFTALSDDNWTIDKTLLYGKYNKKAVLVIGDILENFRDYFEQFVVEVDVPERFYYQPAAFAEFYYGTADLDFLVLQFARMTTLFEFTRPKITVLDRSRLIEFNKLTATYKPEVLESYKNPQEYLSSIF